MPPQMVAACSHPPKPSSPGSRLFRIIKSGTTLMKTWIFAALAALTLIVGVWAQDSPNQSSETVARPRKKPAGDTPPNASDNDLPKIPSKLSPKNKGDEIETDASFKAETNVVTVDVQVLDNKGNPIPNIPKDKFRILEDNAPQNLTQFSTGEAPMTVAMVIEFSARFQAFYTMGWAETLTAS